MSSESSVDEGKVFMVTVK